MYEESLRRALELGGALDEINEELREELRGKTWAAQVRRLRRPRDSRVRKG